MSARDRSSPARGPFLLLLGVAVAIVLVPLVVAGMRTFRDLDRARDRLSELEARVEEVEAENRVLERRVELLRDDPAALERLARGELGLARPGEVVILLGPEADRPAAEPAEKSEEEGATGP